MASTIYMIPCPINEESMETIPNYTIQIIHELEHFIVERAKTSRRYIKATLHPKPISDLQIEEMDKHKNQEQYAKKQYLQWIKEGKNIGILSEAGCPGIADPGAEYVKIAHDQNCIIKPLVGPSSILLALMASGMNGQEFSFHGYLPNKSDQLNKKLKELESKIIHRGSSEIFIETPYRNSSLLQSIIKFVSSHIYLTIAMDITGKVENIQTKTIGDWKKIGLPNKDKIPAIFILGRAD